VKIKPDSAKKIMYRYNVAHCVNCKYWGKTKCYAGDDMPEDCLNFAGMLIEVGCKE
jgi:hypothetical protein